MSAAEDDTELRDLLIQNLENNGVLNKLKAEMRAAVFLAMEEQDRLENKTPLINENLKKCLNTKDGRLVATLVMDFLQVFNLDFTLAVFQPEINWLNGLDSRDLVCRELGLSDSEVNKNSPLLLELVRRGQDKDKPSVCAEEPSQKQITSARNQFDFYDKDRSGSVLKEDLKSVFIDLFPSFNQNMLERFISDELRAADKSFCETVDFQLFLRIYKCLFTQCRDVVLLDSEVGETRVTEDKISPAPLSKDSDGAPALGQREVQQWASDSRSSSLAVQRQRLDLNLDVEDNHDEGDSFFDDPLPKPQTSYGCRSSPIGDKHSPEGTDERDLSLLAGDSEGERDDPLSEHSQSSGLRKVEASGSRESPGSVPEAPKPGGGSASGQSRNGPSNSRGRGFRDSKALNDKTGSVHLDDDVEYDDDFNSHRSDLSKSELSIGEEIEEVSIEGPDNSDKFDETTQDVSVSQLSQSHGADYMEDVA